MSSKSSIGQKVLGSLGTSMILLLVQFVILISRTQEFNFSEQGKAALFIVNIDLIAHISMFVGGSSLVYLASRHSAKALIKPAYIWAVLSGLIVTGVLYFFGQIPSEVAILVLVTGILQGAYSVNQQLLLGHDQIRSYNLLQLLMFTLLMAGLLVMININGAQYTDFVYAYFLAISSTYVLSLIALKSILRLPSPSEDGNILKTMLKFGFIIQVGAFAQRLNSRLNLYVLNASFVAGIAMVGLFSTAQSIAEKLMVGSRSLSTVQYAAISINRDDNFALKLTMSFLKLTLYGTVLGAGIMVLIPESVYLFIIGDQWTGVHDLLVRLAPAICILAISNILSHYFSGLGAYQINTYSALIGLGMTLLLAFILIPESGIIGCIQTITISYSCKTIYQLSQFLKRKTFSWRDLVLTKEDLSFLKRRKSA